MKKQEKKQVIDLEHILKWWKEVIKKNRIGTSIVGRKKNTGGIDFYQTPRWATEELLKIIEIDGTTLEPCSGNGAIAKLIPNCIASDIREDDGVYGEKGKNIFSYEENSFDNIITNPPFAIAQEVIEHSLKVSRKKVFMLLKLQFLESARRYDFFRNTPLKRVNVFCKRITMYPADEPEPKNSGTIAYAWYEWEKGYMGKPEIEWIL